MSTTPIDISAADGLADAAAPARAPGGRVRGEGGRCGNCGFDDTGHYCSRCGEPLHGTQDTVLQILWSDLVEGPVHNLFALGKTTWLILLRPRRFFHGVLKRQQGLADVPFFLAPAWRRVSHKPHGVPNAVKYFVLIYTLTFFGSWMVGVNVFPVIALPFTRPRLVLPGTVAEPLFLLFVVCAAWMYAAAVSRLLGGKIDTDVLTKFMLYLNGFALLPFVGMGVAGTSHPWTFFTCLLFWLYVLFVIPQLALPRLFGISRARLGFAQGGAAVANLVLVAVMLACTAAALNWLDPGWMHEGRNAPAAAARPAPFDPELGLSVVRRATEGTAFPMDTLGHLIFTPAAKGGSGR